jgi:hypothetical protein
MSEGVKDTGVMDAVRDIQARNPGTTIAQALKQLYDKATGEARLKIQATQKAQKERNKQKRCKQLANPL